MMPSFIKTTLKICFLSVLYISCAIAMDDEDKNQLHVTHKIESHNAQDIDTPEEKKCCPHWGLTRWLWGIKEYTIDRWILCENDFNHSDPERAYIAVSGRSSDCFMDEGYFCNPCYAYNKYGPYNCFLSCCSSLLCCPFVTITHILCLPYQCCLCTPPDWHNEARRLAEEEKEARRLSMEKRVAQRVAIRERQEELEKAQRLVEEERWRNMTPEERMAEQDRLEAIRKQEAQYQAVQDMQHNLRINAQNYYNINVATGAAMGPAYYSGPAWR